jgi:hypothetical protein
MLVSDSKRFIFVHVPKAAGKSVREALAPYALPRPPKFHSLLRLFGLPRDYRRYRFRTHGSLRDAQRILPNELFRDYFKFAFVRNPWDRLVSSYHYILERPSHPHHRRVRRLGAFSAYVEYEARRGRFLQYDLLIEAGGRLGMDFVGRFESLAQDFARICDRLGIAVALPHANVSRHRDYTVYYDQATRKLVERHWRKDIETFGYTFGDGPC